MKIFLKIVYHRAGGWSLSVGAQRCGAVGGQTHGSAGGAGSGRLDARLRRQIRAYCVVLQLWGCTAGGQITTLNQHSNRRTVYKSEQKYSTVNNTRA